MIAEDDKKRLRIIAIVLASGIGFALLVNKYGELFGINASALLFVICVCSPAIVVWLYIFVARVREAMKKQRNDALIASLNAEIEQRGMTCEEHNGVRIWKNKESKIVIAQQSIFHFSKAMPDDEIYSSLLKRGAVE